MLGIAGVRDGPIVPLKGLGDRCLGCGLADLAGACHCTPGGGTTVAGTWLLSIGLGPVAGPTGMVGGTQDREVTGTGLSDLFGAGGLIRAATDGAIGEALGLGKGLPPTNLKAKSRVVVSGECTGWPTEELPAMSDRADEERRSEDLGLERGPARPV